MRKIFGYILYALTLAAFVVATVGELCGWPLWVGPADGGVAEEEQEVEIVVVGDVMAHLPQVESAMVAEERYCFVPHFEGVRELFGQADYVVANLETTLSSRPPYCGYPAFATPEELAHDLAAVGVDAVTIANNHITDKGAEGVLHTLAALANASVECVGAAVPALRAGGAKPLVAEVGGFKVAFVGCTDVLNRHDKEVAVVRLDTLALRGAIESVRPRVDVVALLVHWGEEYHLQPSGRQREHAEWARRVGVDLVLGSHPHVIQPWEVWTDEGGKTTGGVFYSLGNFISNQNDHGTDRGLAARIRLRRSGAGEPLEMQIAADTLYRLRHTDTEGKRHYAIRHGLGEQ